MLTTILEPLPANAEEFVGPYPPTVAFLETANTKLTGNTATMSLEANDDSKVQSVVCFVNGVRVEAKPDVTGARPLTADGKAIAADAKAIAADSKAADAPPQNARRYTVTLPPATEAGSIKIQAIAFDEDGLQSPRAEIVLIQDKTATTTTTTMPPAAGRLLGLCVGVSKYQDARLNLKYADKDAFALAADMNQQHGLYHATQVTTLTDDQATAPQVRAALDQLVASTTRTDTVLVFLSGHGWRDETRNFYFATHEVDRNHIAATALPWQDVIARLTKLSERSKRVIVLLDACHSGSAATNEELVKAILGANAGVLVFASSRGSEVSLENAEWAHGAFTKALLEGIEGKAAPAGETGVTVLDFLSYVARRVKTLTENQQHPQVPFLQDFDTDAAIVAKP